MLSEANILILGVARNCEKAIRHDVFRLYTAFQAARELHWFIVESDSSDRTPEILHSLAHDLPNFDFRSLGPLASSIPLRTARIAHCRNTCLDELDVNPLYAAVDYVAVADLDGVNNIISAAAVTSCWSRTDWDVCTANQRGPYYDLWALRHPVWNPNDCWKQYAFFREHGLQRELAAWVSIYGKMISIPKTADWIPVDSAFGGLAIYRRFVLSGVHYAGADEAGEEICEHVWLHGQLRSRGARIFINPRFINTAETVQSHDRSFLQSLRRYLLDLRHQFKLAVLAALSKPRS